MKRAGMTWVKKQLRLENGIDTGISFINSAHAYGFKIMLGVVGDKNALASDFEGYVGRFAQFVGQLASSGADAIEVWNEPNINREWPSGQISGANYTQMLQAAYNAIKSANSGTLVISGAPAPSGGIGCSPEGMNDDCFIRDMAAAGAAQYMDCVGIHYNAGIVPPDWTSGAPVGSAGHYSWYLPNMMQLYRSVFQSTPLCFTELGYLTGEGMGDPIPGGFAWAADTTLTEQAAWLAGAVNQTRGSGYVSMMIVWNVNFSGWTADPQGGYAMLRPDGGCPACDSLGAVMSG